MATRHAGRTALCPEMSVAPIGGAPQRTSRRYIRGIKEELGNRWSAESYRRSRQAQKEGVGMQLGTCRLQFLAELLQRAC